MENLSRISQKKKQKKTITQFKILSFYYCLLVVEKCLEKCLKVNLFLKMHIRVKNDVIYNKYKI